MSSGLLSVDIESALRKLTHSQLARAEMRSVELVRSLFAAGASRLDLHQRRDALVIHAPNAEFGSEMLSLLAIAADPHVEPDRRFASLVALENLGGMIWLALAMAPGLCLFGRTGDGRFRLEIRPDRVDYSVSPSLRANALVKCGAVLYRRTRLGHERRLLNRHLRFSRRSVRIDGRDVPTERFEANLPLVRLVRSSEFEGYVRIHTRNDYSCIRWIDHEVLDAERYSQLAGGVAHEAFVHCARDSAVRERAVIAVRDIRESTVANLPLEFDRLPSDRSGGARQVLLARAIERNDVGVLGQSRLFETRSGQRLNVTELVSRAAAGPIEVTSIAPAHSARRLFFRSVRGSASESALVLDAQGRRVVTELLGLPIDSASRVSEAPRLRIRRLVQEIGEGLRNRAFRLRSRIGRLRSGSALSAEVLTVEERRFIHSLQQLVGDGTFVIPRLSSALSRRTKVEMVPRGRLPLVAAVLDGQPYLRLPRSCPILRRIVAKSSRDPTLLYPALDLMFDGHDGWGARRLQMRSRYLRGQESMSGVGFAE